MGKNKLENQKTEISAQLGVGIDKAIESQANADANIFNDITYHLLHDVRPSVYIEAISTRPQFKEYPLCMLHKLKGTEQSPVHHPEGDVWNHTLLVVDQAASVRYESSDPAAFMWAALLHDIGKPSTTKVRKGKITSYDHDKAGAVLCMAFLKEFTDDRDFIRKVSGLVRYHMQLLFVLKGLPFADISGIKRDTDIKEVALLALCDRLGRTNCDRAQEENIRLFIEKCERPLS